MPSCTTPMFSKMPLTSTTPSPPCWQYTSKQQRGGDCSCASSTVGQQPHAECGGADHQHGVGAGSHGHEAGGHPHVGGNAPARSWPSPARTYGPHQQHREQLHHQKVGVRIHHAAHHQRACFRAHSRQIAHARHEVAQEEDKAHDPHHDGVASRQSAALTSNSAVMPYTTMCPDRADARHDAFTTSSACSSTRFAMRPAKSLSKNFQLADHVPMALPADRVVHARGSPRCSPPSSPRESQAATAISTRTTIASSSSRLAPAPPRADPAWSSTRPACR